MSEEFLTLSHQELDRLSIIQSVIAKHITQISAAERLSISTRQVKRLVRRYRHLGASGLISGHRGKKANNAISQAVRQQALSLIRQRYFDFSPTFAHEKLTEQHGLRFSVETLRKWMMKEGIWQSKSRKQARVHQGRLRRPCLGELIQIDGSPHDWFEGRSSICTLIVFIDDATGRLMALKFAPAETTQAYMQTLSEYLTQHGRPVALYSDKHSIFRVNHVGKEGELTQFSRALRTLDIEPIHANTPQAKGRVERANQTLQDRLVKEMRLRGINDIESANHFLPTFIEDYNGRFAVPPSHDMDAHRPILHDENELGLILSLHHTRKLSKNLTIQFQCTQYQLQGYGNGYRLRGAHVTLCEAFDGTITVLHNGKSLSYKILEEGEKPMILADEKSIYEKVDEAKKGQVQHKHWKPAADHPWKKNFKSSNTSTTPPV